MTYPPSIVNHRLWTLILCGPLLSACGNPPWTYAVRSVAYAEHPDTVLDVMRPRRLQTKASAALVFHGGGWIGGSRSDVVKRVCERYLQRGFVVANIEYRHDPAPAAVADAFQAARWFAAHCATFGADPARLVATGESAGAHLALLLGLAGNDLPFGPAPPLAAVVSFSGIADIGPLLQSPFEQRFAKLWIGDGGPAMANRLSPLSYAGHGKAPVISVHGDTDPVVPFSQAEQLTAQLEAAGARAELVAIRGKGHGDFSTAELDDVYRHVFKFLNRQGAF